MLAFISFGGKTTASQIGGKSRKVNKLKKITRNFRRKRKQREVKSTWHILSHDAKSMTTHSSDEMTKAAFGLSFAKRCSETFFRWWITQRRARRRAVDGQDRGWTTIRSVIRDQVSTRFGVARRKKCVVTNSCAMEINQHSFHSWRRPRGVENTR